MLAATPEEFHEFAALGARYLPMVMTGVVAKAPRDNIAAIRRVGGQVSKITGRTARCAIVADPIVHVRTPDAINRSLEGRGVDGVMVPVHVGANDLADVVASLKRMRSLAGFIATVPHKSAMLDLCDTVTDHPRFFGVVNVVRRTAEGELIGAMVLITWPELRHIGRPGATSHADVASGKDTDT